MKKDKELLERIGKTLEELSNEKNLDLSEKLFLDLIEDFKLLGPYNKKAWHWKSTQKWWLLFEDVSEKPNISSLLNSLNIEIAKANSDTIEPLEYLKIELTASSPSFGKIQRSNLESLIKKYPNNVELLNTYAHLLTEEKSTTDDFELGIELYKEYVKHTNESDENEVVWSVFNSERTLYIKYRERNDDLNAKKVLDRMSDYLPFIKSTELWNMLMDAIHLHDNMNVVTSRIQSIADTYQKEAIEISKESSAKTFEQLVVFTAIITFVVTAAGSAINSSIPLLGLLGLGTVLLVFVLTVQLSTEKPTFESLK
uniref:hypothetical protein n=1 Tax=Vibrio sonorensis TaxID=1004316 RepID=UPI001114100E